MIRSSQIEELFNILAGCAGGKRGGKGRGCECSRVSVAPCPAEAPSLGPTEFWPAKCDFLMHGFTQFC